MYISYYRKYRPMILQDIIGQDVIVQILSNSILQNKLSHCYLFYGQRGVGKTSVARIFARIINCKDRNGITPCNKCISCKAIIENNSLDVIEIDAASNSGVDNIRSIQDKLVYQQQIGTYKIYILDEIHMLSKSAFNALLATIENPPKNVIFIFATTELYKIPNTVISRCLRLDFKSINKYEIINHLKEVSNKEKISYEDEAIETIAILSEGSLRDSLSILESISSFGSITIKNLTKILMIPNIFEIKQLLNYFFNDKYEKILEIFKEWEKEAIDVNKLTKILVNFLITEILNNSKFNQSKVQLLNNLFKILETNLENSLKLLMLFSLFTNFTNSLIDTKDQIEDNKNLNVKVEENKIEPDLIEIQNDNNLLIDAFEVNDSKFNVIQLEDEPIVSRETKNFKQIENYHYHENDIINILLQIENTQLINSIKEKWKELKLINVNYDYQIVANILKEAIPIVSNDKVIIIGFSRKNQLNEFKKISQQILYELTFKLFKKDLLVYGVSVDQWKTINENYLKLKDNDSFKTEPIEIKFKEIKLQRNLDKLKAKELFGDLIEELNE